MNRHVMNKGDYFGSRRKEYRRLRFVSAVIIVGALLLVFGGTFAIWWQMMPQTESADISESLSNSELMISEQIQTDIEHLADTIGERNMHTPGSMERTVNYLVARLEDLNYVPVREEYTLSRGIYTGHTAENISVEITGRSSPDEILIIGAHYDTVHGSPGANDNASGVAVLLALAELIKDSEFEKSVRLLFFANEEPPFFQTGDMGSYAYAKQLSRENTQVTAMIALDGLGYFDERDGTQSYPLPGLGFVYPKSASFLGLVTRLGDLSLLKKVTKSFNESGHIPVEAASLPGFLPGVNWSDHWSFWQHGYPGLLITDTLLFRDPYYHTANDTPERLDFDRMALITFSLEHLVHNLSGGTE